MSAVTLPACCWLTSFYPHLAACLSTELISSKGRYHATACRRSCKQAEREQPSITCLEPEQSACVWKGADKMHKSANWDYLQCFLSIRTRFCVTAFDFNFLKFISHHCCVCFKLKTVLSLFTNTSKERFFFLFFLNSRRISYFTGCSIRKCSFLLLVLGVSPQLLVSLFSMCQRSCCLFLESWMVHQWHA